MNRFLPVTLGLFLAATSVALAQPYANADRADTVRFARAAEAMIEQGIDAERARLAPDAPALTSNPDLIDIARARSDDMADGAPFSHEDASGRMVAADLVRARFGPYGAIGENIMEMGGSRDFDARQFAREAVEGWMRSPGHRRNILDADYAFSGIGVAIRGDTAFATQVFFGPPANKKQARR